MTSFVDPTSERFAEFRSMASPGPIQMLNLIRFRDQAAYPDGHEQAGKGLSGAQAYGLYGRAAGPVLARVGGRQILLARPELTLIGPADERWDLFFIAQYPDVDAFVSMIRDDEYRRAVVHRQAAVADSRLVRMQPSSSGVRFGEA